MTVKGHVVFVVPKVYDRPTDRVIGVLSKELHIYRDHCPASLVTTERLARSVVNRVTTLAAKQVTPATSKEEERLIAAASKIARKYRLIISEITHGETQEDPRKPLRSKPGRKRRRNADDSVPLYDLD